MRVSGSQDTASPLLLCDVCPAVCPSLPPCWSWPWLEFSAPPPAGRLTPDGISDVPGVLSGASFSSSAWGLLRVHHVRRASCRERKYCLTQVPLGRESDCGKRGLAFTGGRQSSETRNRHRAGAGGLALSPNALSFEKLRPLSTCSGLRAHRLGGKKPDREAGAP